MYFCIFVLVLFSIMAFFQKRKIENEVDFIKKINKNFRLKYIILFMLLIGMILYIISYILSLTVKGIWINLVTVFFAFPLVSVEWAIIFNRIDIYSNFSKDEIVNQYISFFAVKEMSSFKYVEIITWFSRWNHKYFRSKDNDQEIDRLIIKLELLLRPYDNGLCLASHHKNSFLKLCAKLNDCQAEEKLKAIENESNKMKENPPEKYRIFTWILDRNIIIYCSIIVLHVAASILVSDDFKSILGNILFNIPSDILVILVYKGIINDREENKNDIS